jgi:hypothetical protein
MPEMLLASPRAHNTLVRKAVYEVLERHKNETMRKHFQPGNDTRYGHAQRTAGYKRSKARYWNSVTDLVKTGNTKRLIASLPAKGNITISGSASADTIRGRLRMRLPFGGGTGRQMDEAAWQRIERELARTTDPVKRARLQAALAGRRSGRGRSGVTPAQMIKELQTITADEAAEMTKLIGEIYVREIKKMKRPRLISGRTLPRI